MWRTLFILWILIVLFLSFYSSPEINNTSFFPHFDKFVHFIMYFVLAILGLLSAWFDDDWFGVFIFLFVVFVFGGSIELLQGLLTEERTASIFDLLFNTVGAISAIGIYRTFLLSKK